MKNEPNSNPFSTRKSKRSGDPPWRNAIAALLMFEYVTDMTAKEKIIRVIRDLPEAASVEDAMEHLLLLAKIERGLSQAETGQTLSHHQMKERVAKWLK
jgi:hypothetical protein